MSGKVGVIATAVLGIILGLSVSARGDAPQTNLGQAAATLPPVITQSGPVQGVLSSDGAIRIWLGLPYAAPPVGERRWKAPQPHDAWSEVLKADAFGKPCAQTGSLYGPPPEGKAWGMTNVETFGKPVGSEDCLSLNIWRPNSGDRALPVLVFVHGGANVAGYSGDPVYDGKKLAAAANAVVVTINYRLGIFGWFSHAALQGTDPLTNSGNFGTLDIIQSLRFVKANIAAFGGDPGNITVMGQSAGAINVYGLMASKLTDGLFQKAIVLSGLIGSASKEKDYSFGNELTTELVLEDGLAKTPAAASAFLAAKDASWTRQYLLSRSTGQVLQALHRTSASHKAPPAFGDGVVLSADPAAAFEQGQFHHVPMIVGVTHDEIKLFTSSVMKVSDAQRFTMMLQTDPDAAPKLAPKDLISPYLLPCLGSGLYDAYTSVIGAILMRQVKSDISKVAKYEPRVFAYRFDWDRGPEPWKTVYGAAHAIDLPFVFGNFTGNFFAMDFAERNRPGREALSGVMMRAIGAFMRSGDPNVPELGLSWKPWKAPDSRQKLILNASDQSLELSVR